MNEKFNKSTKVQQLTKMFLSCGEEKGLTVKDPLAWWYIIIVLIHSFTQWRHVTLTVIFKVIDIGFNTFSADSG